MGFSFNTWAQSWGTTWGNSWGVIAPDRQRIPTGGPSFSRYRWETTRLGQQILEEDKMLLEALEKVLI